jgi:hypothetical protein
MFCEGSPKNELTVVACGDDEDCSKLWDRLNTTFGPRANIHKALKKPQEIDSWLLEGFKVPWEATRKLTLDPWRGFKSFKKPQENDSWPLEGFKV